jgi:glycosyltransferase involved in cell wall biosynthesis
MQIICFLPDLEGGGAQRTVINLANRFGAAGHDVTLAATRMDGPARAWIAPALDAADLGRRRTRGAIGRLAGLVRRRRPAILFASMIDANIAAWAARLWAGPPRPGLVLRETNSHRARGDLGLLQRRLIARAYRAADRVVALSEGVRQELIADYALDPARTVTIHNPVDIDAIAARAAAARREPPPFAKAGSCIVGIGRLHRQKHFDLLIRAVAALARNDVRLILLGEGAERAALERLAAELGLAARVEMPGFVADPVAWLAHADLFVSSSRWEGFGHVIVEAMAAGVPVISTDCPHGPRDIIIHGWNGLLVAPDDRPALTAAIARLLADPEAAKELAKNAAVECRRFTVDRIAQAYLDLFAATVQAGQR